MGMAAGDTSLSDWSLLSPGDEEKLGDWCVPSCSGDAEEHEEMSSSKTSEDKEKETEAEKQNEAENQETERSISVTFRVEGMLSDVVNCSLIYSNNVQSRSKTDSLIIIHNDLTL